MFDSKNTPKYVGSNFVKDIVALPEIIECYNIAGDYDFMLKILVEDIVELPRFRDEQIIHHRKHRKHPKCFCDGRNQTQYRIGDLIVFSFIFGPNPKLPITMNWEQLLSLKRQGDTSKRLRIEQDDTRLGFEVDYDRIIFSSAFRSLQDKTQVIPLSKTDFVHTRLTHSLEVSVVGHSIGRLVRKKIIEKYPHLKEVHGFQANDFGAIVTAASLAHGHRKSAFRSFGQKSHWRIFFYWKGTAIQRPTFGQRMAGFNRF